jgi:hypothetical protein
MSIELRFSEENWHQVEQAWTAWWAGELERPLVVIEGLDLPPGAPVASIHGQGRRSSEFPLDVPADEVLDYYQAHLERKHFYGDAWPKWWPDFGPGIAAGFLGACVLTTEETVWFEPSESHTALSLPLCYEADNRWWQRVRQLTQRAVERWGGQVSIGYTDLGGNLDILSSLRGAESLLYDLSDHPQEIARLTRELTGLWLRYYEELHAITQSAGRGSTPWATVWSPGRCYMLQSDLAYMISPRMFERYVLPDLATCCEVLDHAFYHLDGVGQIRHLDLLFSLERLRGIQWIPGDGQPPPEEWLPLLKRIRDADKLCQLYVSAEGARTIVRELGGRGFVFHIEEAMDADEAEEFLRLLAAEDVQGWVVGQRL